MKKYKVVRDLQGGDFGMFNCSYDLKGYKCEERILTIPEWRETAIAWANGDALKGLEKLMRNIKDDEVIDTISEFWQLEFEEVNDEK